MTNKHAAAPGKLGGAVSSEAKKEASRKNDRKGGRPIKYRCQCGAQGARLSRLTRLRYRCKGCGRGGYLFWIEINMCIECGRRLGHPRNGKCSKGWPSNDAEGRIDG